mmetsp:Transcript_86739/g.250545  ORF Transcript_86739/g.250545 Transcript_86739/m.250545 type:complete len:289 (-) Transcript_86739:257-1123(-)
MAHFQLHRHALAHGGQRVDDHQLVLLAYAAPPEGVGDVHHGHPEQGAELRLAGRGAQALALHRVRPGGFPREGEHGGRPDHLEKGRVLLHASVHIDVYWMPLVLLEPDVHLRALAEETHKHPGSGVGQLALAVHALRQLALGHVAQQHLPHRVAESSPEFGEVFLLVGDPGRGKVPGDICTVGEEVPPNVLEIAHVLTCQPKRILGVRVDALPYDLVGVGDELLDLHAQHERHWRRLHAGLRAHHRRHHVHGAAGSPAAHHRRHLQAPALIEQRQLRLLGVQRLRRRR